MFELFLVIFLVWIVLTLKTSRPDGEIISKMHPYRVMLGYIMPKKNDAVVYYDDYVDAENLLQYIKQTEPHFHTDITHCASTACGLTMMKNPTMNRFAMGRRLYQRHGVFVTFSMKRKRLNRKAKVSAVKRELTPEMTFKNFCDSLQKEVTTERSNKKTYADKELGFFSLLPRPVIRFFVNFFQALDYYNVLPHAFTKNDAMYTSIFVANLGSLGMRAAYHHLIEWGNCSSFVTLGRIEERPVWVDGTWQARKMLHLRFSYDERIDDGLSAGYGIKTILDILSDPKRYLGCVKEDGSDLYSFKEVVERLPDPEKL